MFSSYSLLPATVLADIVTPARAGVQARSEKQMDDAGLAVPDSTAAFRQNCMAANQVQPENPVHQIRRSSARLWR